MVLNRSTVIEFNDIETSRNIFLEGHSDYTITYVIQVYVFVSITIFKNEYLETCIKQIDFLILELIRRICDVLNTYISTEWDCHSSIYQVGLTSLSVWRPCCLEIERLVCFWVLNENQLQIQLLTHLDFSDREFRCKTFSKMASKLVKFFLIFSNTKFHLIIPSNDLHRKSKQVIKITAGVLTVLCILGLVLGLVLYSVVNEPEMPFGPPSASRLGKYQTAAVSSDGVPCSDIGRYIKRR